MKRIFDKYPVLKEIDSPQNLKQLNLEQLNDLAGEIRSFIIESVLQTGGHFGSNLGVVELTLALHYCFDFLDDQLLWDVSHQCYTHKLLTGRKNQFSTLRKLNGLSGFTNKYESPYDKFTVGHAGTAVSTGLGLTTGNRLKGDSSKTIAVVGDASIIIGMSFEAINHTGHLNKDLIIILNDNNHSIDKTIGSFSKYLDIVRTTPVYNDLKNDILKRLDRIPRFGDKLKFYVENVKDAIKYFFHPGQLFTNLSFDYFGPIDGHDLQSLIFNIERIKNRDKPVVLHVVTEKGRGYEEATSNPSAFHGISPKVNAINGKEKREKEKDKVSFTKAFSNAIVDLGKKDDKIIAITAAMPEGTGLDKFKDEFPDRYFDVGISEQHGVGFAAGLATTGYKPVVAIYSTFLQRAYDQIFHEVCLNNLNVIFAIDRAGIVGNDGPTHHGTFDISFLRTLPNMVLMAPKDGNELEEMLTFASKISFPVAIRYPKGNSVLKEDFEKTPLHIGISEILQKGKDIALVGYGYGVNIAIETSKLLKKIGLQPEVVNARFAKPVDENLLKYYIDNEYNIFTIEENTLIGGFGSAITDFCVSYGKPFKIKTFGLPDKFVQHGNRDELLRLVEFDPQSIYKKILEVLEIEEKISIKKK